MNLRLVPRIVGNPAQQIAVSEDDIVRFITWNNGHAPVFAAHNSYPSYSNHVVPEPISILYECTPYDFDAEDISLPQKDAIKLVDRCESEDVPVRIRFSGRKGYHVYRVWKPMLIALRKETQKIKLKDMIRAVQIRDVHNLGLSTMDGRIISDYRRLMRVPNTRWATEKRNKAGPTVTVGDTYCISLTPDELRSLSPDGVLALSRNPRKLSLAPVDGKISLGEYIHRESIDLEACKGLQGSISGTFAKVIDVPNELVKKYMPKPCIAGDLFTNNPVHLSRMASAVYLQQLGFDMQYAIDFIKSIAEQAGWVDRHNSGVTDYQVDHIFGKRYHIPTCTRLKQEGLCIGKSCPIYFDTEKHAQ